MRVGLTAVETRPWESGVSAEIGRVLQGLPVDPLLLAWIVTAVIRVCVGSATVAGLTAAGIDVTEYDRREDDGAQPTVEYSRVHLVAGDTPFYSARVDGAGEYSFRFTTTERSALVRLFFFVEGGIGSSVVFDDISIRKIPPNAGRDAGTEG